MLTKSVLSNVVFVVQVQAQAWRRIRELRAAYQEQAPGEIRIGTRAQLTGYGLDSNQPRLFTYDHASATNALAESMCVYHLAFKFSKALGFNDYMLNHAQPSYKPVSRKT